MINRPSQQVSNSWQGVMLFLHDPITEYSQPARDEPVEKNRPRWVQRTSYKHRVYVEISCTHSQINTYEGEWMEMWVYEVEWIYTSYNFVNHILELLVDIYIRSFPHEKWPHAPDSREQWKSRPVRSSVYLTRVLMITLELQTDYTSRIDRLLQFVCGWFVYLHLRLILISIIPFFTYDTYYASTV